jgi:hypothetical protein
MKRAMPLIAALVLVAACGGGDDASPTTTAGTPSTSARATTTTAEPQPAFPLTGLPAEDPVLALRRALVAKIDNHPLSRPQTSLDLADIVFEENVEGITRFAAVFHSVDPEIVGPVRSGRTQDIGLLSSLASPLFVWSGGNGAVTAAINASTLVNRGPNDAQAYFRSSERRAPHNLYADTSAIWMTAPAEPSPPPAQFDIREPGDEPTASGDTTASAGVRVSMTGVRVQWEWDAGTRRYLRSQDDQPHVVTDDKRVDTDNVVVLFVEYRPSPADRRSPEAQTTGSGEVWVYSAGTRTVGTWQRADITSPWELVDADGDPIRLVAGRTWVQLASAGKAADVPRGVDPGSVPYPR